MQGICPRKTFIFRNFVKFSFVGRRPHPCTDGVKFSVKDAISNASNDSTSTQCTFLIYSCVVNYYLKQGNRRQQTSPMGLLYRTLQATNQWQHPAWTSSLTKSNSVAPHGQYVENFWLLACFSMAPTSILPTLNAIWPIVRNMPNHP